MGDLKILYTKRNHKVVRRSGSTGGCRWILVFHWRGDRDQPEVVVGPWFSTAEKEKKSEKGGDGWEGLAVCRVLGISLRVGWLSSFLFELYVVFFPRVFSRASWALSTTTRGAVLMTLSSLRMSMEKAEFGVQGCRDALCAFRW